MAESSVIGRGSVVRGNVRGEGNLEILGRVEGDVNVTGDVTLGEEALVRGNITGVQVTVAGAVQGDLRGNEAVLIERGGRVIGDLTAPRIGIAPGALVKGSVRTDGEPPLAAPQRRTGIGHSLRASPSVSAPRLVVPPKAEPARVAPPPAPAPSVAPSPASQKVEESEPPRAARSDAPPPPVVPALSKHAKAKKKKRDA